MGWGAFVSDVDEAKEKARAYQRAWYQKNRATKDAKTKVWREANLDRARQIGRESMRRSAASKAIAEGREPGRIGRPKQFSEAEKRAKRKAKTEVYNAAHLIETREKAKLRERAKRAGTFVSQALPRLTDEGRRLAEVTWSAKRRARIRAVGGKFTREDVTRLFAMQRGCCAICQRSLDSDGYHIDHIIPISRGGTNDPINIQLTHPVCNLKKGASLPDDVSRLGQKET